MNKNIRLWPFLNLFYFLLFSQAAYSQIKKDIKVDSLRILVGKNTGTEKISSKLDLSLEIITTDIEEALQLANSALQESKTVGNKKLVMRSFYTLGRIYAIKNNNDISQTCFDSALQITEKTNDNWNKGEILYQIGVEQRRMGEELKALESFNAAIQACHMSENFRIAGSSYSLMGTIFRLNGLYDRAIEYIIKARLNYEKAKFMEGSAWTAYLLGRIYADLKLSQTALEYFMEALEIYHHLAALDGSNNGMAICFEQIGLLNIELGNFDEARRNIDSSMRIYTLENSQYGISNVYKNLGIVEYSSGNYEDAENHLNKALKIKKEEDDNLNLPGIYEYLGLSLIARNHIKDGFGYLQEGLDLAILNNQKKIQLDIYSKMAETYLNTNDLKNAITCKNKQIQIQNMLLSGAANIKTEQLQAIYEIEEKNKQIGELEKQNKINELTISQQRIVRNIMILGIGLALLISVTIYWFYNKLRHKNLELNEINAAKDKFFAIIAHDLRGPTSTLTSFLEHLNSSVDDFSKSELKKILFTLHKSAENVSNLLENLLIWAQSQVTKIEYRPRVLNMTDVLQNSLKGLNQSAEDKQIDVRIETIDQIFVLADPDMVQTIVRNILSNAIKFTNRGGSIIVKSALTDKNTAIISIIDNGVGIEKSKLTKIFEITNTYHTNGTENEKSTGLGLILVKDFVEKNKGSLTINSEKDKGTIVSFTLPITQPLTSGTNV